MGVKYEELKGGEILARDGKKFPEGALEAVKMKNGELVVHLYGGGWVLKDPAAILSKYPFHLVTDDERNTRPEKAQFQVEDGEMFEGYSGGIWNGWQRPNFEWAEAVKVLEYFFPKGEAWWFYHREDDTFYAVDEHMDEPEAYRGFKQVIGTSTRQLYPIGSGDWCWDKVEPSKEDEDDEEEADDD